MQPLRTFLTRAALLIVLAAILMGGDCKKGYDAGDFFVDFYSIIASSAKKARGPVNHYLGFRSKKYVVDAYGFSLIPRELWAPFRWEVSVGQMDPEVPDVGPGFFSAEIDGKDTNPLEFYNISAQPINGGLNVFANRNGPAGPIQLGQVFFAGATVVDFAIEHDGQTLRLLARPHGTGEYTTVGTVAYPTQTVALIPGLGAVGMTGQVEVGFDDFRVVETADPPVAPTGAAAVVHRLWDAVDPQLEIITIVDRPVFSQEEADALAKASASVLDEVVTQVADLPKSKATKKAGKKFRAAGRTVRKAGKLIGKGKDPRKIAKRIFKGLKAEMQAVELLGE